VLRLSLLTISGSKDGETKEAVGAYIRPLLHAYFIWDPVTHHRVVGKTSMKRNEVFRLSARKRSRWEHQELLAEFESLLRGVETALEAAELGARRLSDNELFLEAKRALNPLCPDKRPYRSGDEDFEYRSARDQIVDLGIVDESDTYLNIGGILYSFVSLKELPDATFPDQTGRGVDEVYFNAGTAPTRASASHRDTSLPKA